MKKNLFNIMLVLQTLSFLCSCQTTKTRIAKGKLLDATMDPGKTAVSSRFVQSEPHSFWEKSQTSGAGSSMGRSCPTCGS